jgi:hypothetical protein
MALELFVVSARTNKRHHHQITRAWDYYAKARVAIFSGSQISGRERWNITNPREKMVSRMLQLLQQKAGSGPLLGLLKMQV